MVRRIARRVTLYEISPGEGAREATKQRKAKRKGKEALGFSSIAAKE